MHNMHTRSATNKAKGNAEDGRGKLTGAVSHEANGKARHLRDASQGSPSRAQNAFPRTKA
jgi:uncharacterized protein YjbJ (UPF0337 family)